jgi:hypothetical protein
MSDRDGQLADRNVSTPTIAASPPVWQLVDEVARLSGLLLQCLHHIGEAARNDRQEEALLQIATLGRLLARGGRSIEMSARYWTVDPPIEVPGFVPSVSHPEIALRLAWRTWCLASIVTGHYSGDHCPLNADQGQETFAPIPAECWPLVKGMLVGLPLKESQTLAARLHAEYVAIRPAAVSRLRQPASTVDPVHQLHRVCVQEYLGALEMCPAGWVTMDDDEKRQAVERLASSAELPQYVTLDQLAGLLRCSKSKLEKLRSRSKNPLPDPDQKGGGGKAHLWVWSHIRPWLGREFARQLPPRFPSLTPP